jgi:hypothetical protein
MMIVAVILLVVVAVLVLANMQPDTFTYSRQISISSAPSSVLKFIIDFHKWDLWSPWAKLDPSCKNIFEGPPEGKGAILRWDGNKKVGAGMMTITDVQPPKLVRIQLQFFRPFPAINQVEFALRGENMGTRVTWTMTGQNTYMSKLMGMLINCKRMIEKQFDQGLAAMKAAAEAGM